MFGFGKRQESADAGGPRVSTKLCTDSFNGKYPHVGLYDTRERKIWVCKPLHGQAIRTSHARLITGAENAVSTVWKDRFLCFWFYTPNTGEGLIHGYPIEWEDSLKKVIALDWDRLIPGHPGLPDGRLGTKDDAKQLLAMLQEMSAEAKEQARAGKCWQPAENELKFGKYASWPGYEQARPMIARRYCGLWGRGT